MAFWIVSGALSLVVSIAVVAVLLRRERQAGAALEYDLRVYRDQLKEVDRDVARRVISAGDAERARIEIKRRILEADRKAQSSEGAGVAPSGATLVAAGLSLTLIVVGAFTVYWRIGALGYPDLPIDDRIARAEEMRSSRPSQNDVEARTPPPLQQEALDENYVSLLEQLREKVAERPDDLAGQRLLFQHESNIGNYRAARDAIARVVELSGDAATAMDFANHAEMLVLSAGGYVSPEAEEALSRSLQLDPRNGIARYYTGLMFTQTGRPDRAFRVWSQLLAESTPEAPWQQAIRAQIGEVALHAGIDDYAPPPLGAAPMLPGPSSEDMDAASAMTPAERIEMIEGMVAGLADRLADEGGPPEEWARLIRAYGVLGRTEDAAAIWAEAQQVFPDDATRVPVLQAARDAGVAQ